jgi:PAS domain S-box-containing protein
VTIAVGEGDDAGLAGSSLSAKRALLFISLYSVIAFALLPIASNPGPEVPGITAVFGGVIFVTELSTAFLLFLRFREMPGWSLLFLACAYLFSALMVVPHVLTFPGAIVPGRAIIDFSRQSPAWLFVLWINGYALLTLFAVGVAARADRWRAAQLSIDQVITLAVMTIITLVVALSMISIVAIDQLPPLIGESSWTALNRFIMALALLMLASGISIIIWKIRGALFLWLSLALTAMAFANILSELGGARFSIGWSAGRVSWLISASILFLYFLNQYSRERRLLRTGNELQTIINVTPFMLTRCSSDLRYQFVSRSYAEMIGRSSEDVTGKTILEIMGQEGFETILPHIKKVLQGGRVEYESDVRFQGVGNRVLHVVYTPERDDRGKIVGWIGSINDISRLHRAESQRDLLIAEINHRVKNTLASVIAIARQSFERAESQARGLDAFDDRIRSLARTHTRLADADWAGVPLRIIVEDETAPYSFDGNVRIEGPDIILTARRALSLGMAIHELATNAAKHGALSTPAGSVRICWSCLQTDNMIALEWIESGGPALREPRRSGFGRLLLEKILPADLDGAIELNFGEFGVRCAISFPFEATSNLMPLRKIGGTKIVSGGPLQTRPNGKSGVEGKRILLVEDEALLALEISEILSSAGAHVIGPFGGLIEGATAARRESIDFAVLDMNLKGEMVYPLAEELLERKIPLIFLSGYNVPDVPETLRGVPHLIKPADPAALLKVIVEIGRKHD